MSEANEYQQQRSKFLNYTRPSTFRCDVTERLAFIVEGLHAKYSDPQPAEPTACGCDSKGVVLGPDPLADTEEDREWEFVYCWFCKYVY